MPPWLIRLENRLRERLEPFAKHIRQGFPGMQVNIVANQWGQATGADGYIIYLICVLPDVNEPDNLALEVSFHDVSTAPSAVADVCWGHPSTCIEAEWNNGEVRFTAAAEESFFNALPTLMIAFEDALKRGKPSGQGA